MWNGRRRRAERSGTGVTCDVGVDGAGGLSVGAVWGLPGGGVRWRAFNGDPAERERER